MKDFQDIANLISIRGFLITSIDNLHMKLNRDDIKNIQTRIQYLDKTILDHALKMDLSKIGQDNTVRSFSVESTEDTESVIKKHQYKTLEGDVGPAHIKEDENSNSIKSKE